MTTQSYKKTPARSLSWKFHSTTPCRLRR